MIVTLMLVLLFFVTIWKLKAIASWRQTDDQ